MEQELMNLYTKNYSGVENLYTAAKKAGLNVTRKNVQKFLSSVNSYTLLKAKRHRFPRNRVRVTVPNELAMADLADMQNLARYNSSVRYLLVIIDGLTRKLIVVPTKNKGADEMYEAFSKVYSENKPPKLLQTDRGTEFYNKKTKNLFSKLGIRHFSSFNSEIKASMAERAIRTLKQKIFKFLLHYSTLRYIDALPDLVNIINNSVNRSIGMAPNEYTPKRHDELLHNLFGPKATRKLKREKKEKTLKIGTSVRVTKERGPFQKGYLAGWSDEIFKIKQAITSRQPIVYRLETESGEPVSGIFYAQEIQPVTPSVYRIEKVLQQRKTKTGKQLRVKWIGYKEPTWIDEKDLVQND